jgi:hypothetical protein
MPPVTPALSAPIQCYPRTVKTTAYGTAKTATTFSISSASNRGPSQMEPLHSLEGGNVHSVPACRTVILEHPAGAAKNPSICTIWRTPTPVSILVEDPQSVLMDTQQRTARSCAILDRATRLAGPTVPHPTLPSQVPLHRNNPIVGKDSMTDSANENLVLFLVWWPALLSSLLFTPSSRYSLLITSDGGLNRTSSLVLWPHTALLKNSLLYLSG